MSRSTVTIDWACDRISEDHPLVVECDVSWYVPAQLYGRPEDCYPAEGGDVEVLSATLDGVAFDLATLTDDESAELQSHVEESATVDDGDADEASDDDGGYDRADYIYEGASW